LILQIDDEETVMYDNAVAEKISIQYKQTPLTESMSIACIRILENLFHNLFNSLLTTTDGFKNAKTRLCVI
jgi:hypothetical protein